MIIETKYDVGDTVFAGKAEWGTDFVTCPDCGGTEKWTITSSNGSWGATCQTCVWTRFHNLGPYGYVKKSTRLAVVELLTIGSVRLNTDHDDGHEYMCNETGVGCGRVYKENELFSCRAAAQQFADDEVARQLPEAHTDDQRRQDHDRTENMHHCTRPDPVLKTVKQGQRWTAWIEGGVQATATTKSGAVEALVVKLATP